MAYRWNFAPVFDNADVLLAGAVGTLRLFVICLVVGLSLGLVVGLGRYAKARLVHWPATAFVEFFRNTPVLVQILWFYFALPILLPFEISPLVAAALGISLNSAAFSAEIYRGGIQSIDRGQWEGARALGMTHTQALRRIVLPQALRRALPAYGNEAIFMLHGTSLAMLVTIADLTGVAKRLYATHYTPFEAYLTAGAFYLLMTLGLVALFRWAENRFLKPLLPR